MSWLLPSSHCTPELRELTHLERDLSVAVIRHLAFCKSGVTHLLLSVNISNNYAKILHATPL